MTVDESVDEIASSYSLMDLRDPILDTKREQFLFQLSKEVNLKWHDSTMSGGD